MSTIKTIDFSERHKYLNGSSVGAVVKHYLKKNFKTFDSFDFICSYKKWTSKQQTTYDSMLSAKKSHIFEIGKEFENDFRSWLSNKFGENNIEDFSVAGQSFVMEDIMLSATPDFIVNIAGTKILFETKSSSCSTPHLELYKYQIAAQLLVLQDKIDFKNDNNTAALIYFKSDIQDGDYDSYKPFKVDRQEIIEKQKEIIDCCKMFWESLEKNNFKFIPFEQYATFEEKDTTMIEKIKCYSDYKAKEKEMKLLGKEILTKYKNYSYVQIDGLKVTIVQDTSEVCGIDYYKEELKKKQDAVKECEDIIDQLEKKIREPDIKQRAGYIKIIQ